MLPAAMLLPAVTSVGREAIRPQYDSIVPGLDYAHIKMTNWNTGEPWSIHIARLDRAQENLSLGSTLAAGRVFDTAPVSVIAESFPKEKGEPLVLINAGFCNRTEHPYRGAPRGMVITEGELISSPGLGRANYTFWIAEGDTLHFGKFEPAFKATLPDGITVPIGLNNECKFDAVMLYTHMLGESTRAVGNFEVVLENPHQKQLSWRVGESYSLRVKAVNPSGDTPLSNDIAVLSFGGNAAAIARRIGVGDSIKVELETSPRLKNVITACHAIFPLVQQGKPIETFDTGDVMLRRHPRTAIGFSDRHFFMVVVDGRQKTLSMGMDPWELAEFMSRLGCIEAMNLDGGGSSTFWLRGKTRNSVSDGAERERSDALVVFRQVADSPKL
jgi:hypothetical protein